jgi:endonuclease/exonuclease/phosphatase family metal-dependent hydrolase
MIKNSLIAVLLFFCCLSIQAQENFKVMFYNVLNYPLQEPASRIQDFETIVQDYSPDLFMACEINNASGATSILNVLQNHNSNFLAANIVSNTSDDNIGNQNDLQNMLYYDSTKFILENQYEVTTIYRDFNHYVLKLNTSNQATNPIRLDVFVAHLKSSSGSENQNLRLAMVNDFEDYLDTLPSNSYVVLGGDLNIYTHSEPAYQELLNTSNNITFVDPANRNGSWHNNINYLDVFTQSTRTSNGLGGATGGFDDRFDFILTSENMLSNPDIAYVSNSYKVYGNNNNPNCFNSEIISGNCSGPDYDQNIRTALYYMSDHLPVTLELETTSSLSSSTYELAEHISFIESNSVRNVLKLKVNPLQLENPNFQIYNTYGQLINTFNVDGLNQININVSHFASGMYYITQQYNSKPLKFIKY